MGDTEAGDQASWRAPAADAPELESVDPADSDEATAAVAPEQGGAPTAEGAPGDDPDAGPGSPATEDAATVIAWATPTGTPPVYPATEALEQPMLEEHSNDAGWLDDASDDYPTDSGRDPTTRVGGDPVPRVATTAAGSTLAASPAGPAKAIRGAPGSSAEADVLERIAERLRAGAPVAEGSAVQEAAVLARLLAELLSADDRGPSSRRAPPGPAGVEL